jgi:betaine-aldehyde dehydrogenase
MKQYNCLVNGEWIGAQSLERRMIYDPGNGKEIASVPEFSKSDVAKAIQAARHAFDHGPWRTTTALDRGKYLFKIAEKIRSKAKELAELETRICGKPLAEAEYDVADAANCFEFYGGLATKIHGETMSVPANSLSFVLREPIGVCAQIIPWNYPLLMAAWKIAPALAAGNTCILKPSELTPLTALELAEIICEVELPAGVVNIVTGPGAGAGEELAASPLVDKIAFTGGTITGRKVMIQAADNIKKVSLELGGKNPNIVFADADFAAAIDGALFGAFANQGEVCSAGSRLLVERSIHKKFVEALLKKIPLIKVGHGLEAGIKMGPLVSADHLKKVMSYIEIGVSEGAKLICGGKRPSHLMAEAGGNFLEPTIFDDVNPSMRIACEEIFGPVLSIIPFDTEAEAIAIANGTEYGLAAGVWTQNITKGLRVVKALQAGITWINTYHPTFNEMPWGGYKQSGIGRELGLHGIDAYLESKQVNINLDEAPIGWY